MIKKSKVDIVYYLPNRKSPIAYSTIYTAKLLIILAEIFSSIQSVFYSVYRNQDAKNVLEKFIKNGYANEQAINFFNYQIFARNYLPVFFNPNEEYEILLANSPWINTIEKITEILEFNWEFGSRKWKFKVPIYDALNDLFGIKKSDVKLVHD